MMTNPIVKIFNNSEYELPQKQTDLASGFDLRANIKEPIILEQSKVNIIPTGIFLEIPEGYEGQVRARSGLASKHGITLVNGIGTIDSDYRGEIKVILMNLTKESYTITPGSRIAQLIFTPIVYPTFVEVENKEDLEDSVRGEGGFGSSGNKWPSNDGHFF